MKIIGIQDYPMPVTKWLDTNSSVSWLRTFESMSKNHECYALLREHNYNESIQEPIRGINYTFSQKTDIDSITKLSNKVNPDVIFYNFCEYKKLSEILNKMYIMYPWCLHVVRVHHESKRVLKDKSTLRGIIDNSDLIITGNKYDVEYIKSIDNKTECFIVPFGINTEDFIENPGFTSKKILSSSGDNPVKRLDVLNEIFMILNEKGYNTCNLIGINKKDYLERLKKGRYFLMTSTSEASGSRSLLEAINFGLYPIVTKECESALSICKEFDENYKNYISTDQSSEEAVKKIINIIESEPLFPNRDRIINYSEKLESIRLETIFENLVFSFKNLHKEKYIYKNFIRKFLYDTVKSTGIDIKNLSDIVLNIKKSLKDKNLYKNIDIIWKNNNMPIDNLHGFKEKMSRSDFDVYENLKWIFK